MNRFLCISIALACASPLFSATINGVFTTSGWLFGNGPDQDWTQATEFFFYDIEPAAPSGDYYESQFRLPFNHRSFLSLNETKKPEWWFFEIYEPNSPVRQHWFDMTSINITLAPFSFYATGTGIAHITGFKPTYGTFEITGTYFRDSEYIDNLLWQDARYTMAGRSAVPDAAATLPLLIVALIATGIVQRKRST